MNIADKWLTLFFFSSKCLKLFCKRRLCLYKSHGIAYHTTARHISLSFNYRCVQISLHCKEMSQHIYKNAWNARKSIWRKIKFWRTKNMIFRSLIKNCSVKYLKQLHKRWLHKNIWLERLLCWVSWKNVNCFSSSISQPLTRIQCNIHVTPNICTYQSTI